MKIILLYGGQSAEHEVSIISAHTICQLIMYGYYQVQPIYLTKDGRWLKGPLLEQPPTSVKQLTLEEGQEASWANSDDEVSYGVAINPGEIQEPDVIVFPVLHGPNGEDGTIQGFLEVLNLPYVGAGVTASANGMDKIISKSLFDQIGLPQVPYVAFNALDWRTNEDEIVQRCEGSLIYPLFVKPANMGSSVGISRVENADELKAAVNLAFKYDRRIVVEQGIIAQECEVAVLGNDDAHVSVVGRLVKQQDFYDYNEKYINNTVTMEIPADLPESVTARIQEYALKAYRVIDGRGLSRVDFFVTSNNDVYINEINTLPGFTPFSMYPLLWQETGLSQRDLIEELLQLALRSHETKQMLKQPLNH
ncbi:D-alanine--D-alanine ligase [Fundicoccus culcitae]|uniref:D-alanine--D-alanine ligase n=1 Tax=Fundicoccus culcitae TaxID=2969821 RepID=A0ABY5P479_9LACT|nr:D-alanine--D-alanine ligase [Fundicoccus culcitae]UUX33223.1 D-alanine--D-alanine ligase [Fundicoccus culcitae]